MHTSNKINSPQHVQLAEDGRIDVLSVGEPSGAEGGGGARTGGWA